MLNFFLMFTVQYNFHLLSLKFLGFLVILTMTFDFSDPFDRKSLDFNSKLAEGEYGFVYDATYKSHPVVVKCSKKEENNEMIVMEYAILKNLQSKDHTGVPHVGYSFKNEGKECFIMEKFDTDLEKYLKNTEEGKLSLKNTLLIALQVLNTLKYVHTKGYLHADIKPDNLMIITDNKQIKTYLIDFGFASSYLNKGKIVCLSKTAK